MRNASNGRFNTKKFKAELDLAFISETIAELTNDASVQMKLLALVVFEFNILDGEALIDEFVAEFDVYQTLVFEYFKASEESQAIFENDANKLAFVLGFMLKGNFKEIIKVIII